MSKEGTSDAHGSAAWDQVSRAICCGDLASLQKIVPSVISVFDPPPPSLISAVNPDGSLDSPTNLATLILTSTHCSSATAEMALYLIKVIHGSSNTKKKRSAMAELLRHKRSEKGARTWHLLGIGYPEVLNTLNYYAYLEVCDHSRTSREVFKTIPGGVRADNMAAFLVALVKLSKVDQFAELLAAGADPRVLERKNPVVFELILVDQQLSPPKRGSRTFVEVLAKYCPLLVTDAHTNNKGQTPLLYCLECGVVPDIEALAAAGADWNAVDSTGMDALETVIRSRDAGRMVLALVLEHVRDPKLEYQGSRTFYHIWSETEREVDELKMVAERFPDVDVNKADSSGMTPLEYAETKRNTRVFRALLKIDGVKVGKLSCSFLGLLLAAHSGASLVWNLLKAGFDVDQVYEDGMTPLMVAVVARNRFAVAAFVELTACPNKEGKLGETAFVTAASIENDRVLAVLGAHPRVDVNVGDASHNAFTIALERDLPKNIDVLLYEIPRFTLFPTDPMTFLAAVPKSPDLVKSLVLSKKYDVSVVDSEGRNAIHYAVQARNIDTLTYLLSIEEINPDLKSPRFGTPLALALETADQDMMLALVERLETYPDVSAATKLQMIAVEQLVKAVKEHQ